VFDSRLGVPSFSAFLQSEAGAFIDADRVVRREVERADAPGVVGFNSVNFDSLPLFPFFPRPILSTRWYASPPLSALLGCRALTPFLISIPSIPQLRARRELGSNVFLFCPLSEGSELRSVRLLGARLQAPSGESAAN